MRVDDLRSPGSEPGPADDDTAGYPVWLGLLGSFRLLRHGQPVAVRAGGKTEALLASLGLARRQGVPRHVLLRGLWPESDQNLAANALNNLLHTLRASLADALDGASAVVKSDGFYRLNHEAGVVVDINQFERLANQSEWHARMGDSHAAARLAERAVDLYRGDLTPDAEHGPIAILERERLRATCLGLMLRRAEYSFSHADYPTCLAYVRRMLAYDPCREDAHRLIMRCHVRQGQRAQALRHFDTVRAILRAEYEAEPEPATTTLFDQIRLDPGAV